MLILEIEKLTNELETLKIHVKYMPGGVGYFEAQESFDNLKPVPLTRQSRDLYFCKNTACEDCILEIEDIRDNGFKL